MIRSMTGFGRYEISSGEHKLCVEMKSVNHRYLDIGLKMPKIFNPFEAKIRELLKEDVQRGKLDIYITYEDLTEKNIRLIYNETIAGEYLNIVKKMQSSFGISSDITSEGLLRLPEVITMEQKNAGEDELWAILKAGITGALESFITQRTEEGERLKTDLLNKLDTMHYWVADIEEGYPMILTAYRKKLEIKVCELLEDKKTIEDSRILSEVAIYADKICVDEETVRLRSHITAIRDALIAGGCVGRKLDFIAQELNREANTVLSKINDPVLSSIAINMKTEIEKIREQVQNIE